MLQALKSFTLQVFNTENYAGLFSTGGFGRGFSWSRGSSVSLYEKSIYASSAIRKRAEKVGQIKFVMKDAKGEAVIDTAESQEWLNLLSKPNDHQTGTQFFTLAQKYYDTVGAAYIRKNTEGKVFNKKQSVPSSLTLLKSDCVVPQFNSDKTTITGFLYSGHGTAVETISPDEIIYWYNPSQTDPLEGESLLSSAVSAIEGEYEISKYHANVLKNGGKVDTMFRIKGLTTAQQLKQLKEDYEEQYNKSAKKNKPLFVGGDIESVQTGLSPRELGFLDTKVSTYRDLAIVTGVSKELLGNTDGSSYQNAYAALRIFLQEVVNPLQGSLTEVLDWRLIPETMTLSYINPTPEDREEMRKDIETAHRVEAVTTNEIREKLGLEARSEKESDQVLVSFNKRALSDGAPAPKEPVPAEPAPAENKSSKKKDEIQHPLKNKQVRKAWGKFVRAKQDENNRRMTQATQTFFNDQRLRILSGLKGKKKTAVDEVFNRVVEILVANTTLVTLIRDMFIEQGLSVADTFGLSEFNLTTQVEKTLRERAALFNNSIINTQNDKLVELFKESQDAGESRSKLVKRINELYTGISDGWAGVIARTEVHSAMQSANLEAYYQGGLKVKIWVWGPGVNGGAREEHQAMDGEEQGIDEEFSNGEKAPSLPNCGCTI